MRDLDVLRVVSIVLASCGGAFESPAPVTAARPAAVIVSATSGNTAADAPANPGNVATGDDGDVATIVAEITASHPASPPTPAPAPVATPPTDDEPTWEAHECNTHVWSGAWREEQGVVGSEGRGGRTLDDKIAQLDDKRPIAGVCDVRLRDRLEAGIRSGSAGARTATTTPAWDRRSPLEHADIVRAGLSLTPDEEARLVKDGFVVPARLAYDDYATAYSDIHRGQLPVYVSVDSILHAVYISHDQLVGKLETELLVSRLDHALGDMHCALVIAAKAYPKEIADDVDLYLAVARSLLAGAVVPTELGHVESAAQRMVRKINDAAGVETVSLFGRDRAIDFGSFAPRGHYAADLELANYFRAAMWLSRTEFNLVSRDSRSSQPGYGTDPRETPREAVVALALADLADRAKATANLEAVEAAWTTFAGRREDVSFADLAKLRRTAKIATLTDPDAAARLRIAIGEGYKRSVNIHPMTNVARLPVIATMIGPRIVPDTIAIGHLVDGRGPELTASELGYMLGHDRALAYIGSTRTDPTLRGRLDTARTDLVASPSGEDLYSAWLDAIRALAKPPAGTLPTFMASDAFADLRLDSALVAYGQLRHNHVLFTPRVYDQGGCEIPDGYVEPAIDTYVALLRYAKRGHDIFAKLDPKNVTNGAAYFTRLGDILQVLATLSREELANHALSTTSRRFLAMIVEDRETSAWGYMGSFPIAVHNGWYLDLFPFQDAAFEGASFIADYAAFDRNGTSGIHYLGGKGPQLGVFVVDTGGKPRMMVGPVARGFQHTGPRDKTLDDGAAQSVAGTSPWTATYTLAAAPTPDLAIEFHRQPPVKARVKDVDPEDPRVVTPRFDMPADTLRVDSARSIGDITVDVLDHHFVPMTTLTIHTIKGRIDTPIDASKLPRPIEAFRVHAGKFQAKFDLSLQGGERAVFGTDPNPPEHRVWGAHEDR